MARESRSRFAILGMLTLRAMTGYELRREIENTVGHFWQESFGQLYPALAALETQGLVSVRAGARGGRERRVYGITKKGRAELRAWLTKSPLRHVERNELLLKLFFATEVDVTAPIAHVEQSRADAVERLRVVREMSAALTAEHSQLPGFDYYWAALRYGELGLDMHLRWCDEVLARLGRVPAPAPA